MTPDDVYRRVIPGLRKKANGQDRSACEAVRINAVGTAMKIKIERGPGTENPILDAPAYLIRVVSELFEQKGHCEYEGAARDFINQRDAGVPDSSVLGGARTELPEITLQSAPPPPRPQVDRAEQERHGYEKRIEQYRELRKQNRT